MAECCTNVVVMTKNISSVSMTSISEITLISKSSWRAAPMRMSLDRCGSLARARRAHRRRRDRRGRFALRRQFIHQQDDLLFHADHVVGDETAEIAVEEVGRNRNAQTRRGADQRLADAAGHLQRITD